MTNNLHATLPYIIIGAGRMATHLKHYLNLLSLPCLQWSRNADPAKITLPDILAQGEIVFILINDGQIENFIASHQNLLHQKKCIHFSGQLVTPLAYGAHPLMTFSHTLYPLEIYQKIPFILDKGAPPLSELLPGLNNPYFFIAAEKKAFYHSLCVMSGNFTCLLWQKFFTELQQSLDLPEIAGKMYLQQIFDNININPHAALTGPLVRNDKTTIEKNLRALQNDPFVKIYKAFVEVYNQMEQSSDEHS